jgi:hypothetical protein
MALTQKSPTSQHEVPPELAELGLEDKPDGPGAAALIAAGVGIAVMGLFTLLSEVSEGIHDFLGALDFGVGVGPLAGKSIFGVLAFGLTWVILGYLWKEKELDLKPIFWWSVGLGLLGAILMFPPVFTAFG